MTKTFKSSILFAASLDRWWCWSPSGWARGEIFAARLWWLGSGEPDFADRKNSIPEKLSGEAEAPKSEPASSATNIRTSRSGEVATRSSRGRPPRMWTLAGADLGGGVSFRRSGLPSDVGACGKPDPRKTGTRGQTKDGSGGSFPCWRVWKWRESDLTFCRWHCNFGFNCN